MRRAYVATRFGQVHVRTAGSGAYLVCIHQSPSSSAMYEDMARRLGGRFRLIAPDSAGFGGSPPLPDGAPSIAGFADRIEACLDSLDAWPCVLLGHHTGSAVAVELAWRRRSEVRGLAIYGFAAYTTPEIRDARRAAIRPNIVLPDGAHIATPWARMQQWSGSLSTVFRTERAVEELRAGDHSHFGSLGVVDYPLQERMAELELPTLFMAGSKDRFWQETRDAAAVTVGSELVEFEGCSQWVCAEAPERFAETVSAFAARVTQAP